MPVERTAFPRRAFVSPCHPLSKEVFHTPLHPNLCDTIPSLPRQIEPTVGASICSPA